ncbi:MAG: DUF3618 domain-containing protein [Actinomycetota bacterium]
MTTTDPDQIRAEIAETRRELSDDVNALAEQTKPRNIAQRKLHRASERATSWKEQVIGKAHGVTQDSLPAAVSATRDAVGDAPERVAARTQGSPLAAGLVAFGIGAILGSLFPVSQQEARVASDVKNKAKPLKEDVASMAQEAAQQLREPAQQAVHSVKEQARAAASTVKDAGSPAAHRSSRS